MFAMLRSFAVAAAAVLLTACSTPMSKQEIAAIHTVAIRNEFPKSPNLANIGTTIFNNEYGLVESAEYKQFVTDTVAKYLGAKGFTVVRVDAPAADMVLELIPRDAYNQVGTMGYGFHQRSMFGIKGRAASYVALNIRPMLDGKSRGDAFYRESFSSLSVADLPTDWLSMSPALKAEFDRSLKANIEKTVTGLLDEIGF